MKTSEALRIAKEYLAEGAESYKRTYICHAVNSAAQDGLITSVNRTDIHAYIQDALGKKRSLEGWLWWHHFIELDFGNPAFQTKMQVTRHAWVDSMIAEFRSKGD